MYPDRLELDQLYLIRADSFTEIVQYTMRRRGAIFAKYALYYFEFYFEPGAGTWLSPEEVRSHIHAISKQFLEYMRLFSNKADFSTVG